MKSLERAIIRTSHPELSARHGRRVAAVVDLLADVADRCKWCMYCPPGTNMI
jgi:hypothetical protein